MINCCASLYKKGPSYISNGFKQHENLISSMIPHHIFIYIFYDTYLLYIYIYMYGIYIHVCKNANNVHVIILSIKCICVVLSLFVHVDKEYELIGKQLRYTLNRIGRRQKECTQILRGLITNMNII